MSRLGKSFKNRFLRRALAMVLAGTMVMTGMPVSFAAESTETEASVETEVQSETEAAGEEAAEDNEAKQKETEETETQEKEGTNADEESTTASETESLTTKEDKETETASSDSEESTASSEIEETETSETDTEETETSETDTEETETEQTTEEEENEAPEDAATLAEGHKNAKWGIDGKTLFNKTSGTYTNSAEDILYVDATSGKFDATNDENSDGIPDRIQVNLSTKIYIPVSVTNNKAKIIIYQRYIKDTNSVIYDESKAPEYGFALSGGTEFVSATCTSVEKVGDYYRTELSCDLSGNVESAVICVEVKGSKNTYITQIISGEEVRDDVYDDTVGASEDFVKYNIEGYAKAYGVTGGGVIKEGTANYYTVSTADDFIKALKKIQTKAEPAVIRITDNLNLGSNEFKEIDISEYDTNLIKKDTNQALMHPVLGRTGVSHLALKNFKNLTIFSTNAAAIKHCKITIQQSENIMIRNVVFDELWEWDDIVNVDENGKTKTGEYDRNDWDYITVDNESDGVWIDHCTFYKAYDGVIDLKNSKKDGEERITVSWCRFEPKSAPKEVDGKTTYPFYDAQMAWLEKYKDKTNYYKALRSDEGSSVKCTGTKKDGTEVSTNLVGGGYSVEDVITYTCGQKKTHLFGASDGKVNTTTGVNETEQKSKGMRVTLANNIYINSMDRLPRLRFGIAHEYNCVLDSSQLYKAHYIDAGGSKFDNHIVSNGAISTMKGSLFLENCYIEGIKSPILSGNGDSDPGYIGFEGCKYVLDGKPNATLVIEYKNKLEDDNTNYVLTRDSFLEKCGYTADDYTLYTENIDTLKTYLENKAGAGVVVMNPIRWTKTNYDGTTDTNTKDEKDTTDPAYNDKTDYSIDNSGEEEGGDPKNPPIGYEDSPILNANELEAEKITKEIKLNNHYTVKGTSDGAVTIKELGENGKITVNEKEFTKAISLVGPGSADKSAIAITVPKSGKLTVYASQTPVLANASNEQQTGTTTQNVTEYTIETEGEGTYTLYASENGSDIYYIEFTEQTQDPSGNKIKQTLEFRVDTQTPGKLTGDVKVSDYFTIKTAAETSNNEIKAETINIDGKDFTKYVKLNGGAKKDDKSIKIYALGGGTLTIYAKSSSTTGARIVNLLDSDGNPISGQSHEGVLGATSFTLQIPEKGIYYVGSASSGLFIYGIDFEVTYEEGETLPIDPDDEEKPEDPETEVTAPTFTAPEGDKVYDAAEGNDQSKVVYNIEGYAAAANVTGGGLLKEDSANYHTVSDEKEFLDALDKIRGVTDKPNVIEITADLNLGSKELNEKYKAEGWNIGTQSGNTYSGVIRAYQEKNGPLMHPTLKDKTGVSYIQMNGIHNLTIFSKNGAAIKHAGIKIQGGTDNLIIRNLVFDELWEWDDKDGGYDRNDWDYVTIEDDAEGIWVDHCTFYKAYDGILDIKCKDGGKGYERVTISWCEFLPGSKDNTFFNEQMQWLENHKEETTYYKQLRQTMEARDVWWYAYGQKKTHLFGLSDADKAIRVTIANNYYKNSMDRLPRLRNGKAHEYNSVLDSHELDTEYRNGNNKITGNGAISTDNGELLLENCYIRGIRSPLRSGNGTSKTGYINAVNSVYYLNGQLKELNPEKGGTGEGSVLITDTAKFKEKLPYAGNYITYDATQLYTIVVPYAGAGKLELSTVQWEKTSYGSRTGNEGGTTSSSPSQTDPQLPNDNPPKTPWDTSEEITVAVPTAEPVTGTKIKNDQTVTLSCTTEGAKIYYTLDGATIPTAESTEYTAPIAVPADAKTLVIKAVAIKDGISSDVATFEYTISETTENPPITGAVAMPMPGIKPGEVPIGMKLTLRAEEGAKIYYTLDGATDPTENSTEYTEPIDLGSEAKKVIIRAIAVKDGEKSAVAVFEYTVSTEINPDAFILAPVSDKTQGEVKAGTKVTLSTETKEAKIYYTLDGTDPTEKSTEYTAPIDLGNEAKKVVIKAIAVKGENKSDISTFEYTVVAASEDPKPPVNPDDPDISDDPDDPGTGKKDIWITGLEETYYYTGAKIIPDIKVWDCDIKGKDRLLIQGVDYAIAYKDNSKVTANAQVIITGKGNYEGKGVTERFSIVMANAVESSVDVKGAKIEKIPDKQYTGEAIHPDFKLTLKNKSSVTYTYNNGSYARADGEPLDVNIAVSNNVNQGSAAILVTGKKVNGKETSAKAAFKITPIDLSRVNVEVKAEAAMYAVKGAVPELTVTYNGQTLVNGRDYVAKYGNNKKAKAKGTVTITGKGNYAKNAKPVTYDITQLDMSVLSVSAATVYDKITAGKVKATVLDRDGNELKPAQYTLKVYRNGTECKATDVLNAGETVSLVAAAKDANLTGSTPEKDNDFKVGKDISKAKFKIKKSVKKTYTGSEVTLVAADFEPVTLKGASGSLEMGRDFEVVAYSNNINKGNATAVIRGIGDYSGTKTIKFKITQKKMVKGSSK